MGKLGIGSVRRGHARFRVRWAPISGATCPNPDASCTSCATCAVHHSSVPVLVQYHCVHLPHFCCACRVPQVLCAAASCLLRSSRHAAASPLLVAAPGLLHADNALLCAARRRSQCPRESTHAIATSCATVWSRTCLPRNTRGTRGTESPRLSRRSRTCFTRLRG